jgi:hypothetical protein
VEDVEAEVEKRAGNRKPVHREVLFGQVKTARPHEEHRRLGDQLVRFFRLGRDESDGPAHGIHQIGVTLDEVVPCGRGRVFEIGHEDVGTRVHRVDDHLAVDRTRNLDAAIEEVVRNGSDGPAPFAYVPRLRQEVRTLAPVEPRLSVLARGEQFGDAPAELSSELRDELDRLGREHAFVTRLVLRVQHDVVR